MNTIYLCIVSYNLLTTVWYCFLVIIKNPVYKIYEFIKLLSI